MDYQYDNYTLSIFTDETYSFDSTDNKNSYDLVYINGESIFRGTSIAIYLKRNDQIVKTVIVNADSYYIDLFEKSLIIVGNELWILLGNEMFSFDFPDLNLLWKKELDMAVNFAIYELQKDFLVHGEMEIFRVTKKGEIVWRFSGGDIWVNLKGKEVITFRDNSIHLVDFNDDQYTIDFDGKII